MSTEYRKLRELIQKHNFLYYELSKPIITDKEYDLLLLQLAELEAKDPSLVDSYSPTQLVGGYLNPKFTKIKHKEGMLSLQNSYSEEDILAWEERIKKEYPAWNGVVLVENKLDGISCGLHYELGKLKYAVTRGNGEYGEDITENAINCYNIPQQLQTDYTGEIRGELLIFKKQFAELNTNNEYANSRNLCSGTIRQKDPTEVKKRKIIFAPYYVMNSTEETMLGDVQLLHQFGFETYADSKCISITQIQEEIKNRLTCKDELPMDTDGLVFKVNDKSIHNAIGYTSKFPKWAIAFKFDTEKKTTLLKSVDFQIGKTGIITPVANLVEIELAGTKVSRASLHNFDEVKKKDIQIGDYVIVEKAAEIIPYISAPDLTQRVNSIPIVKPTKCPFCSSTLIQDGVYLVCNNSNCDEKKIQQLIYFTSKDCMDINGLSEKTIRRLYELKFLQVPIDLFDLYKSKDDLVQLKNFGLKSIDRILDSIEASKSNKFEAVLNSLSIPNIGRSMSKRLVQLFPSIDNLMKATKDELLAVEGIADLSATEIVNWFADSKNQLLIQSLKDKKVNLKAVTKSITQSIYTGKKVCITGSFEDYNRSELKEYFESLGAIVVNSISKKTDYLICGTNAGSKLEKAITLGISIVKESDLKGVI